MPVKVKQKFSRNITKAFEIIGIDIKVAFTTTNVGNYFSFTDRINRFKRSCLVYLFQCPGDMDKQYVGETK